MEPAVSIALMFDLDGASKQVREIALGLQRFAKEHGQWSLVFDPVATKHLDGRYNGLIGPASIAANKAARRANVPYVSATCGCLTAPFPNVGTHPWQVRGRTPKGATQLHKWRSAGYDRGERNGLVT